jgi:hypothetical protein
MWAHGNQQKFRIMEVDKQVPMLSCAMVFNGRTKVAKHPWEGAVRGNFGLVNFAVKVTK